MTLKDIGQTIQTALKLLTTEEADAIIGQPGPGYQELLKGLQAQESLFYELMTRYGLKRSRTTEDSLRKHLALVLTLLHIAYALGVKRGREERQEED
jgi:endo-alpha-1,4-polygalactosaminidase (GH114 family)